jgi:4'-phosphopantetheinyl transferase
MTPSVRVIAVDLDVPASTVARFEQSLPAPERDVRPKARLLRAMTREVLAEALGRAPAELDITRECEHCGHPGHGRPRLRDADAMRTSFSVSHSGSIGIIALTHGNGTVVGVDVEQIRPRHDLARLAARTLGAAQLAAWQSVEPADQLTHFLQTWTAKEAYLKATGTGIAGRLADVPDRPSGFSMRTLDAPQGYVGTIAVGGLSASGETAG